MPQFTHLTRHDGVHCNLNPQHDKAEERGLRLQTQHCLKKERKGNKIVPNSDFVGVKIS